MEPLCSKCLVFGASKATPKGLGALGLSGWGESSRNWLHFMDLAADWGADDTGTIMYMSLGRREVFCLGGPGGGWKGVFLI